MAEAQATMGQTCQQLSEILDQIISGLEETVQRLDRIHTLLQDTIVTLRNGREATHAHR